MNGRCIGVLHPGEMGAAVAGTLRTAGRRVLWCSEGRSAATRERARAAGIEERQTLGELLSACEILLSICPPHGAEALARAVMAAGYRGVYADLNAISPLRAETIAGLVEAGGGRPVDGGIIGPPPERPGTTRVYLSGRWADEVSVALGDCNLEPHVLEGAPGQASALKMAFASLSKGQAALVALSRALASHHGLESELLAEWAHGSLQRAPGDDASLTRTARVAWRWMSEMEEIAATARAAGLPGTMHQGAAELFRRWGGQQKQGDIPVDRLLAELLKPD